MVKNPINTIVLLFVTILISGCEAAVTPTPVPPTTALAPTSTTGSDDPDPPDGTGAVSDVDGGTISINTVEQIVLLKTLDRHTASVLDVAFSSVCCFLSRWISSRPWPFRTADHNLGCNKWTACVHI
jgi:hypothetical protein